MEYGLVALWLVTYLALGLAALPAAAVLFERLPDGGAGVALPLALVLVTMPAYWVGRVAFGWPALVAGVAALVAASAVARRRFDAEPAWEPARDTAVVFAVAFLFLVAVRAVDPAVHPLAGEKFLDFGMLKALQRAPTLPPEDFWFAGEPVNYYYGGHLVASLLTTLTGTKPAYAYNLALAGFYAMYVTAAYGVGGAIGQARGVGRRGAGLATVFFVGLASNLATPARAVGGRLPESVLTTLAPEKAETFAEGLSAFTYWPASRAMRANVITEFPLFAFLNGDLHAHMTSTPFTLLVVALLLAYYRTPEEQVGRRRLLVFGCVPVVGGLLAVVNTWSFPSVGGLTALALLFAPADPTTLLPTRVGAVLRGVAAGPAGEDGLSVDGGAETAPEETPGGALGVLGAFERVARTEGVRWVTAAIGAATVLVPAALLVFPFFLGPASTREVAVWDAARRSGLSGLLLAHGGFLVVFVAFLRPRLAAAVRGRLGRVTAALLVVFLLSVGHGFAALGLVGPLLLVAWLLLRTDLPTGAVVPRFGAVDEDALRTTAMAILGAVALGAVYLAVTEASSVSRGALLALLPVAAAAVALLAAVERHRSGADPGAAVPVDLDVGFESVLLVAGAGLVLVVEVLYVVEEAGPGRFNTVFKTYAQVWLLWGTAAGVMFATLVRDHVVAPIVAATPLTDGSEDGDAGRSGLSSRGEGGGATVFAVGAALLLVGSLSLYGGLALGNHFTGTSPYGKYERVDDPTLNATAFVEGAHAEEAPAIRWLDAREGRPVLVTAAPGGYQWNARDGKGSSAPASLTGLPTVAGWFHERGYRGGDAFRERVVDVRAIYTGTAEQRACLLATYDVEYVYVGPAERAKYGERVDGVAEVSGVGEPTVFSDGAVAIYPVDQSALPSGDC
jgi:YYY domain-containing protein